MHSQAYSQNAVVASHAYNKNTADFPVNYSMEGDITQMPLSQSGFYTNPLNQIEMTDDEKAHRERRAVTRDKTTSKRSKRSIKPSDQVSVGKTTNYLPQTTHYNQSM